MSVSQSQPVLALHGANTIAEPSVRVEYSYEYRNWASHEWRRSAFHENERPADLQSALEDLAERVKRWVPGTQLRLVVTTHSSSVSPPFGEFSPVRIEREAASPADAQPKAPENQ